MAKTPITTTAPTGLIAPFGLRMLPELRQKLEEVARKSGRSMNAELVARLEESFQSKSGALSKDIEMHVAGIQTRREMLGLRTELIKMRLESLAARERLTQEDIQTLLQNAVSDADFARIDVRTQDLQKLEDDASALGQELEQVLVQRAALKDQTEKMILLLAETRGELEARVAAGRANQAAIKQARVQPSSDGEPSTPASTAAAGPHKKL